MKYMSLLVLCFIALLGGCLGQDGQGSIKDSVREMSDTVYEIATITCIFVTSIFQVAGAIGALIIVFAGMKWASSQDNPTERKNAKDIIVAVIVGLIIIYIAKSLVSVILQQSFTCSASGVTRLKQLT